MRLTDHTGRVIPLGRQIGRAGGEGSVFEIVGSPQLVGKLYHHASTPEKIAKLEHLRVLSTPRIQSFAAFPTSVLYENGRARGFVMPLVRGKEIHQLFGPKERFVEFPSAKWDFLVRVAQNCAAAFDEVHKLGVVIGDVNEGNVLVSDEGLAQERSRRQAAFESTTTELGGVFTEMLGTPARYQADFEAKKRELQAAYNRFLRLDQERAAELRKLHQNMEEMQRRDFLDRQLLVHASINGIGPARLRSLLAYGFESALDIRYGMGVPRIGPTYERRLMEWRRKKEGQFRFDLSRGVPKQELHQLDLRMLDVRRGLENQLKQGPSALAQVGAAAASACGSLRAASTDCSKRRLKRAPTSR